MSNNKASAKSTVRVFGYTQARELSDAELSIISGGDGEDYYAGKPKHVDTWCDVSGEGQFAQKDDCTVCNA